MRVEQRKLGNGSRICFIRNCAMNTILLCHMYYMPLNEEASKNAMLSKLLMRGTLNYRNTRDITRFLYDSYGAGAGMDISLKGEIYTMSLYCNYVNPKKYGLDTLLNSRMLGFIEEVFSAPLVENGCFNSDYFITERNNLLDDIEALINNKDQYAFLRCCQEMCSGEPYSIDRLGKKDWVNAITQKNLMNQFLYIRENCPSILYVMGDVEPDIFMESIDEKFKKSCKIKKDILMPSAFEYKKIPNVRYVQDNMDLSQGKLFMGFRTNIDLNDPMYPALMVANSLLGGGPHSILFKTIREEKSLCYTIYSTLEKYKGLMFVMAGINPEDKDRAQKGIAEALEFINNGKFCKEDMENAVAGLRHSLCTISDDKNLFLSYMQGLDIYKCSYTLDDMINSLDNVSRDEIIESSKRIQLDTVYFLGGR